MQEHLELNQFGHTCHAWVFLLKRVSWFHSKYTFTPTALAQQQPGTLLSGFHISQVNFREIYIRHSERQKMKA